MEREDSRRKDESRFARGDGTGDTRGMSTSAVEYLGPHPDGTVVFVWVVPNASRDEIVGLHDDRVKVRVAAPAEGGKANRKVCALLAPALGGSRGIVLDGESSRRKAILVPGVDPATAVAALADRGVA